MKNLERSTGSTGRKQIGGRGRLRRCRKAARLGAGERLEERRLLAGVSIDWVTVGNAGNAADTSPSGYGAVDYTYRIMKFEFTNAQYAAFLNAVDPQGTNPNSVWSSNMQSEARGGISLVSGNADGAKYATRTSMADKPVNYVSWFDAARVANWLHNGAQTYAATDATATAPQNTGAYTLGTATSGTAPAKNAGARFHIPTEHEWYKAAYYKSGGTSAGYWDYATQSDTAPTAVTASATGVGSAGAAGNFANRNSAADWNALDGNVTTVGTNGGSAAYGTFDQAGNIAEWNDLAGTSHSLRGVRGGSYASSSGNVSSAGRGEHDPLIANDTFGFRLASLALPPGQPTGLSGAPGAGQVSLTWTAPASNGGALITDYVVEYKTTAAATWTTFADGVSTTPAAIVTGLTNGTSYVFRVSAKNDVGTGDPTAASSSVAPRTVPGQPTSVSGSSGDARVSLSWSAPGANGGASITDYVIEYKIAGGASWTTFADGASTNRYATVTGLTNATGYVFRVSAVNAAGTGAPSEESGVVTPVGAPHAPTAVVAAAQRGYAIVSWTAPASDGGSALASYALESSADGGSTWSPALTAVSGVTSARVDSLYDGATYRFRVKATNALGTSIPSTPSAAVTLPRQPGWPVQVGGPGADGVASIVTVGGATIITGSFSGAVPFGTTTLTSTGGSEDVFVAKLDADGSYAWAVRAGGAGSDRGTKIAALADGTVAVIGACSGSATFGGTTLTTPGGDSFITKIRVDDGTFVWARRVGDTGTPWATGIAALADGAMVVTGEYYGSTNFGGTTLPTYGTYDAFVAKLNAAGSYVWAVRAGAPDPFSFGSPSAMTAVSPGGIAALPDGSAYVAGYFTGTIAFGGTTLTTPGSSSTDRSIFVAKVTPTGAFSWVRQATSGSISQSNEVSDVAVLGTDVVVVGTFRDNLNIADTDLWGSGTEAFLAQWSTDGSPMGALRAGGNGDDFGGSFSNGFMTGVFDASATFGPPFTLPLTGSSQQAFVAKFSSYGTASPGYAPGFISWAATTAGGRYEGYGAPPDVAVLPDGSPVIVGQFSNAAVFGTTQLPNAGGADGFVARMYPAASSTSFSAWSYGGFEDIPTDVTGVPGNGQVGLTWLAPSASAPADYLVEYSSDGGLTWTTFSDGVSSATSATVTGLANGTSYRFRISAVDSGRLGRPSQLSALMTPTLVRSVGFPKQAVGSSIDSLTVFGDGSAAVTGYFTGSGIFGGTTVTGTNPQADIGTFAARVAADGAFSWAREAPGSIAAAAAGGATLVAGTKLMEYPATYDSMSGMWQPSFSATHMVVSQLKADGSTGWRYSEGATPWYSPGMYPLPGDGSVVQPQAMTTLPDGSVVVAGMRNDSYYSYPSTMNPPVFFLRKINADGSAGWGQSSSPSTMYGYGYYDTVTSLTAFSDGSTLMAGRFGNELPFGSSAPSPSPSPSRSAFVAKFAANGTVAWSRQLGEYIDPMMPPGYSSYVDVNVAGMTTLPDGSALVAGSFSGQVTFDTTTLYAADFSDGFIVKLAADGTVVWAQSLDAGVNGITTLTDGSVLATGSFAGSLTVGTQTLTSAGDSDAFIVKVASNGSVIWARRVGGAGVDAGGKIAALPDGSALVAGVFSGTVAFGSASLTSVAATDTFIAKIGADGTFVVPGTATTITVGTGQTVADTTVRTGTAQLVKQGVGTLILDLANSHSGGTVVEAGEVVVRNVAALGAGGVVVTPGALLTLDVGPQAVPLSGLDIQAGGLLDVGTGRIVLGAGTFDLAAIRGHLSTGHGAGTGPGSTGIASSTAAATPGRAVGHAFDGAGNLVVGFAACGDLNLDGLADFDDILAFISAGRFDSGQVATWDTGDFDYNGVVDFDDVLAMISAGVFDQGPYLPAASPPAAQSFAQSFAVSDPPADAEPVAAAKEGFDPSAAAFASLAAEQQATGDGATTKKRPTVRTV